MATRKVLPRAEGLGEDISPEQRLAMAVLQQALMDYSHIKSGKVILAEKRKARSFFPVGARRVLNEIEGWMFKRREVREPEPFSLQWIAEVLGSDLKRFRKALKALIQDEELFLSGARWSDHRLNQIMGRKTRTNGK